MPELPEVETVARVLAPQLRGCVIDGVGVRRMEVIAHPDAPGFCTGLTGRTIADLTRRGKYLLLLLTQGGRVAVHLRMTGCLLLAPADRAELPHTHVVFRLRDGRELRFSDARRFGRLWLLQGDGDDACAGMRKLGREPFDRALTAEYLRARLGERRRMIKACLLGQDTVAGIGNIYADEILFSAGICPLRPADSLRAEEWARLAAAIPERLAFLCSGTCSRRRNISTGTVWRTAARPSCRSTGARGRRAPSAARRCAARWTAGAAASGAPTARRSGRDRRGRAVPAAARCARRAPLVVGRSVYGHAPGRARAALTWRTVETTCAAFPARLTAEAAACLSGERLAQMIRPCGFAKAKARAIHAIAAWFCRYGCDVRRTQDVPLEALRAQLLSLFGVGEETADVILVYALYRPSFIIDAYTRRLLARLGGDFSGDAALRRYFTCALRRMRASLAGITG